MAESAGALCLQACLHIRATFQTSEQQALWFDHELCGDRAITAGSIRAPSQLSAIRGATVPSTFAEFLLARHACATMLRNVC